MPEFPPMSISFIPMFGLLIMIVLFGAGIGLALRIGSGLMRGLTGLLCVAGALLLIAIGGLLFFSVRVSSRHVILGDDIAVRNSRVNHNASHLQYGADSSPMPQAHESGRIDIVQMVESNARQRTPEQSLDELWSQMNAPRIKLDGVITSPEGLEHSSPREIAEAAKVILGATLPSADPFTQGWLINAAKAIVKATPNERAESKSPPDWVSNPQNIVGPTASTDPTQMKYVRRVVSTDPLKTLEECRDQLEKRLRYAVGEQVRALAKQATRGSFINGGPMLSEMGVTPDFIVREFCPEGTYVETVKGSDGDMLRAHALLEFTPPKEQVLLERWQTAMQAKGFGPEVTGLAVTVPAMVEVSDNNDERPDWVVHPPKQVGNVRKFVVVSDPYYTADEGREEVDRKMQELVLRRANELTSPLARRSGAATLNQLGLGGDYVRREICTDEYVETFVSSVGEMKRVYALIEFNQGQDAILADRVRAFSRRAGVMDAALLGGGLLGCVAILFGLLKADTWTRGYYTKRLFLGVPAAIITVLTLLMS